MISLDKPLYTLTETADILGVARSTVYNWRNKGLIKVHQIEGTRVKVTKEEIERLLGRGKEENGL